METKKRTRPEKVKKGKNGDLIDNMDYLSVLFRSIFPK